MISYNYMFCQITPDIVARVSGTRHLFNGVLRTKRSIKRADTGLGKSIRCSQSECSDFAVVVRMPCSLQPCNSSATIAASSTRG